MYDNIAVSVSSDLSVFVVFCSRHVMVFGIVVYEARTGLFRLLRIGLLHTEQGCSIDLMFPEFTVVLQQVFPGIIPVMLVQKFWQNRSVHVRSGYYVRNIHLRI